MRSYLGWERDNMCNISKLIKEIIIQSNQNHVGQYFYITVDNLNIHWNLEILEFIIKTGYSNAFRASCLSCVGATEYVFNTIHCLHFLFNTARDDWFGGRILFQMIWVCSVHTLCSFSTLLYGTIKLGNYHMHYCPYYKCWSHQLHIGLHLFAISPVILVCSAFVVWWYGSCS